MLLHVTHTHGTETCMAHDPKRNTALGKTLAGTSAAGIKVHSFYIDAPGHTFFWIVEADTAEQIAKYFDPILELGHFEVVPVVDASAYLEA